MNTLIKNITAILPDGEGYKTEVCDICVSGDTIAGIGSGEGFAADKVIDGGGRLATAGLVNAHTHSYMSLFRNSADDLMFHDWLFGRIMPMEDKLTQDDLYWGTQLACLEMIKTGTTAFLDMNICRDAVTRAISESGLKAVISRGLVGNGRDDEGGIARIEDTIHDYNTYGDNKRLKFTMGPHAIYTTDRAYLELVMDKAAEYGMGINVHLSESVKEVEDCYKEHGCSPVEYLDDMGMFKFHTVAAHCVQLSDKDIEILADRGVYVASNPISNAKLGNGFARIPDMQKAGVRLCIGTDSAGSNNTLNMFSDMMFMALCHKGNTRTANTVTATEILKMATETGAAALGLENTGVLKEGGKADIVIMNMNCPSLQPINDPVAAMCYSANGSEVESVMVDGELLMENRVIPHMDEEKIYYECNKAMKRIDG
ncbi:MAG: amidohydrolase [Eubacterium sp.]|nr:amidohydrolase [Eubacterium sp.]